MEPQGESSQDLQSEPQPLFKMPSARWETARNDARTWTEFTYNQINVDGPQLIATRPRDVADFCPNYDRLTTEYKRAFWVYLISSIVQFESNFKPETSFTENFTDSTGASVISRGLLQLSIESARAYGCVLANAQALHDPYKNLSCGLKILSRWVGRDGVIRANDGDWKGGARYWSVLRRDNQYASIRGWTSSQTYCRTEN